MVGSYILVNLLRSKTDERCWAGTGTASLNISGEAPGWNTLQQAVDVLYHKLMQLWLYGFCDVVTAGNLQRQRRVERTAYPKRFVKI
jgi:hypothetical protein